MKKLNRESVKSKLFNLYLSSSILSSLFFCFYYYNLSGPHSFIKNTWPLVIVLVASYSSYLISRNSSLVFKKSSYYPGLFLLQASCFLLMNIISKEELFSMISLIPIFAGTIFLALESHYKVRAKVISGPTLLWVLTYFAIQKLLVFDDSFYQSSFIISTVALWGFFFCFFTLNIITNKKINFLGEVIENNQKIVLNNDRERFFVHDLINQTHGISLFLSHRIKKNQAILDNEAKLLLSEIKIVQSLIQNFYKMEHQNIYDSLEWGKISDAKKIFENTAENYFKDMGIRYTVTSKALSDDLDFFEESVHFPSFLRIIHNIVKNISETDTKFVSFIFSLDYEGLTFISKNKIKHDEDSGSMEAADLGKIILQKDYDSPSRESLGLDSIDSLCEEIGGHFSFSIENGEWINKVFIPYQLDSEIEFKKSA